MLKTFARFRPRAFFTLAAGCAVALTSVACDDPKKPARREAEPDAGHSEGDAGVEDDGGVTTFGGLVVDTAPEDHDFDLFGTPGHRFWVEVSDAQRIRMNEGRGGFPGPIFDGPILDEPIDRPRDDLPPKEPGPDHGGDIYTPGLDPEPTYADHVVVQDARSKAVADYGKIEVKVIGESTHRPWERTSIPNLRFDTDEFQKGLKIGGFEHFRLNNGLVGSIYRELIAHRVFRALGYPALRGTFAFLGSNVWGEGVWIPMTLIEVYKKRFCEDNKDLLGGTCTNIWEFPGDAGVTSPPEDACQSGACVNTKLDELALALASAPQGEGFKAALESIIDWPRFHQFQCIGWILWTGDDALRNSNNNLIIERDDGKLVWAPYSVDISAGQDWYTNVSLYGTSTIAQGCQSDPTCWADTIAECRKLVKKFDKLNPEKIVDDVQETLEKLGMLRAYDKERAAWIRNWYVERQKALLEELEYFKYPPGPDGCPEVLERCGDGSCGTPEQCEERRCPIGTEWCESRGFCVDPAWDVCPVCEGDVSFYCPLNDECVASVDECGALCGRGQVFCPEWQTCVFPDEPCGVIEPR